MAIEGKYKKYSWKDILDLVYADCGLETDLDRRQKGTIWCEGGFMPPAYEDEFCLRIHYHDRPESELLEQHLGDRT